MLARLLLRLARLSVTRPWTVLFATTLPALLATVLVTQVPLDLSFTGILDRKDPRVATYYDLAEELNFSGRVYLLLEGPDESLDEAAAAMTALEELEAVDRVFSEPPEAWLREQAPYLVSPENFELLLRVASEKHQPALYDQLETNLLEQVQAVEGARLVLLLLADDPVDAPLGTIRFATIETMTQALLEPFEQVKGGYAGVAALADQDQQRVMARVRILTPVSLLLVLAVLTLFERRPAHLVAVAVPMLLAGGATLGIVGKATGTITMMETFYGVMIFGLGVDFALHLMVRTREELLIAEDDFQGAVERAWSGSGPGVVIGGLTTAGAFAIVAMADDPSARHLGLSGSVGLILCLFLMLSWLPAAWTVLRRGKSPPRRIFTVPGLATLAGWSGRHPVITIAAALALMGLSATRFPDFHYETDLSKVFTRDVPALRVSERVHELYGLNPGPWVLRAENLEQARDFTARVIADPLFARVDSLASLFPEDMESRQSRLRDAVPDLEYRQAQHHRLLFMAGPKTQQLHQLLELIQSLLQAADRGPPGIPDLPPLLAEQLIAPDGRLLLLAYNAAPTMDGTVTREERRVVQAVDPEAAGIGITLEVTMEGDRPWIRPVWIGILAYVVLLLILDLRRPRRVLAALAPVVFGLVVTVGVMCWWGPGFNVMSLVVAPLIVGLGVDDGVHVVHRIREQAQLAPHQAAVRVGQAIVLTTATTSSSFLLLYLFSGHVGLESMARVLLIGLPACLLASVTLVPALMSVGPTTPDAGASAPHSASSAQRRAVSAVTAPSDWR